MTVLPHWSTFRTLGRLWFRREYEPDIHPVLLSGFYGMYRSLRRRDGAFGRGVGGIDTLLLCDECSKVGAEVVPGDCTVSDHASHAWSLMDGRD